MKKNTEKQTAILTEIGAWFNRDNIVHGVRSFTDCVISGLLDSFVSKPVRAKIDELYSRYWRNVAVTTIINCVMIAIVFIAGKFFTINTVVIFIVSLMILGLIIWAIIRFINTVRDFIKVYHWEHFDILLIALQNTLKRRSLTEGVRTVYRMLYGRYNKKSGGIIGILHVVTSGTGAIKTQDEIENDVVRVCSFIKDYAVKFIVYRTIALSFFYGIFLFVLRPYIFSQTIAMNWIEIALYPFTVVLPAVIMIVKGWFFGV
jgi:hypothetical protein